MEIRTGKIEDGRVVITGKATVDPSKCPNIIFNSNHYRNGTCDCFNIECTEMEEWGYTWNNEKGYWDVEDE